MDISFEKVTDRNKQLFKNLWQFFGYDFSEMNKMDVNENGEYTLPDDLDEYIESNNYCSYIVKVKGMTAGLAVIKFIEDEGINYFRHFFIMRKFRRLGVGKETVFKIFQLYPGRWRVSQFDFNIPAISFWRSVIKEYTDGQYTETRRRDDKGPQQEFCNVDVN